jgi:hypothetical protein
VLAELGYGPRELDELAAAGVVGRPADTVPPAAADKPGQEP